MFIKKLIIGTIMTGALVFTTQAIAEHANIASHVEGGGQHMGGEHMGGEHMGGEHMGGHRNNGWAPGAHRGHNGWYDEDCNIVPFIPNFYYYCPENDY